MSVWIRLVTPIAPGLVRPRFIDVSKSSLKISFITVCLNGCSSFTAGGGGGVGFVIEIICGSFVGFGVLPRIPKSAVVT